MSLGASFALTPDQVSQLKALRTDEEREAWLEELEESIGDDDFFEYDKAWVALHLSLGDGRLVINEQGPARSRAVFGSEPLMQDGDAAYFAGVLPAEEVGDVSNDLQEVDEDWLRGRYFALDESQIGPERGEDDFA